MTRILSALCFLPLLILLVHYGSPLHFLLLIVVVIGLGLLEFYRMLASQGFPCRQWLGLSLGLTLPVAFYMGGMASQGVAAAIVVLIVVAGVFARQETVISLQSTAYTLLGVFYVSWLLSHVLLLRGLAHGQYYVFYIFLVVWLGDAAALYVGTLLGRHKLVPSISPGKTIEGAIGGLIGSVGGALLGRLWLHDHFTFAHSVVMGGMLALLGQLGDLSESLLKRSTGAKDSAHLIPGHGGILDKVDGILFSAPAMYYYLVYVTRPGLLS